MGKPFATMQIIYGNVHDIGQQSIIVMLQQSNISILFPHPQVCGMKTSYFQIDMHTVMHFVNNRLETKIRSKALLYIC